MHPFVKKANDWAKKTRGLGLGSAPKVNPRPKRKEVVLGDDNPNPAPSSPTSTATRSAGSDTPSTEGSVKTGSYANLSPGAMGEFKKMQRRKR